MAGNFDRSPDNDVVTGRDPDGARRGRATRVSQIGLGVLFVALGVVAVISARGTHHRPTGIFTDTPTPTPTRPPDADPAPTPSVYLGPGPGYTADTSPHDVNITFSVWNESGLDVAVTAVHFVLVDAGHARVLSASIHPQRVPIIVPPSQPAASIIMAHSAGTVQLDLDPDCTHRDVAGYLEFDLFGIGGALIHQRVELPYGLSLRALIASSCQSITYAPSTGQK